MSIVPLLASWSVAAPVASRQQAQNDEPVLSRDSVLRDPDIPAGGNAEGDITIVEYLDYQCPYCKKVHPDLAQVVREDGKIRIVYKNWPIFGGVSVYAARMVLAAKYQDKYAEAHEALITSSSRLTESRVRDLLAGAGVDLKAADAALSKNETSIVAALARNDDQARAFGFQGTPAFIIGTFRVPGVLSIANFKQAIADARAAK